MTKAALFCESFHVESSIGAVFAEAAMKAQRIRSCAISRPINPVAAILLYMATSTHPFAEEYPNPITPWTSDYANVLDEATEGRINKTLQDAREDPGVEIAVVTINSRGDYGQSESIEAFAAGLFNKWGIGHQVYDNGILLLFAVEDRQVRIELGAGYSRAFDATASRTVAKIIPELRAEGYDHAIELSVSEVVQEIALPFMSNRASLPNRSRTRK